MWGLPAGVAQVEHSIAGVAVVDENGLFSILVLKLTEVLIGAEVIDVQRRPGRSRVVIADLKERSVTPVLVLNCVPIELAHGCLG